MANVSDNPRCCAEHLQRMGHGVIDGEQFITGCHCTDGQRVRCNVCHRVWEHACDEAEGCAWVCRSLLKTHSAEPAGDIPLAKEARP